MNLSYQKELNQLAELLNFGADCFAKQKIEPSRIRRRKQFFLAMTVAAFSNIEAIYSLCKEKRSHPCLILLRTLYENYINAKFLFCSPNLKHYYILVLDDLLDRKKQSYDAVDFLKTNPSYSSSCTEIKDLEQALKETEKRIKKTEIKINKYSGKSTLDIRGRAQYIDDYNKRNGIKSKSVKWIYVWIYRQLSSSVHLKESALQDFFERKLDGSLVVYLSGNPADIKRILEEAYNLLRGIISMFLTVFEKNHKNPLKAEFKKIYG